MPVKVMIPRTIYYNARSEVSLNVFFLLFILIFVFRLICLASLFVVFFFLFILHIVLKLCKSEAIQ